MWLRSTHSGSSGGSHFSEKFCYASNTMCQTAMIRVLNIRSTISLRPGSCSCHWSSQLRQWHCTDSCNCFHYNTAWHLPVQEVSNPTFMATVGPWLLLSVQFPTSQSAVYVACVCVCVCDYLLRRSIPMSSWVDWMKDRTSSPNLFCRLMKALGPGWTCPGGGGSSSWTENKIAWSLTYLKKNNMFIHCTLFTV